MEGLVLFACFWITPPAIFAWAYAYCKGEGFMQIFLRGLLYWPLSPVGIGLTIYWWTANAELAYLAIIITIAALYIDSKLGKK